MKEEEIVEKLKDIFKLVVNRGADLTKITKESKLVEDLGINSVGAIYLSIAIEEVFGVDVSEVSYDSFKTVGDVIEYIGVNC